MPGWALPGWRRPCLAAGDLPAAAGQCAEPDSKEKKAQAVQKLLDDKAKEVAKLSEEALASKVHAQRAQQTG